MRKNEYIKISEALAKFDYENKTNSAGAINTIFESLHGEYPTESHLANYSILIGMGEAYDKAYKSYIDAEKTPLQRAQERELAELNKQ